MLVLTKEVQEEVIEMNVITEASVVKRTPSETNMIAAIFQQLYLF